MKLSKAIKKIETHLSSVYLFDQYAYKIKKNVNYGFVNFSTLEKRKFYCEEELRLNKKGAEDIYISVVPVSIQDNDLFVENDTNIVDYAVKMKRFDEPSLFSNLLSANLLKQDTFKELARLIYDYHEKSLTNKEITNYGDLTIIKGAFVENFDQTEKYIGISIEKNAWDEIKNLNYEFFELNEKLFSHRQTSEKIRECHGDLHMRNICFFNDKIQLFDCLEFKDDWRYVDVMYDVAFAFMDLEVRGFENFAEILLESYLSLSNDKEGLEILPIYLSRQAFVRGKVISFLTDDQNLSEDKEKNATEAEKYFKFALKYAKLNLY